MVRAYLEVIAKIGTTETVIQSVVTGPPTSSQSEERSLAATPAPKERRGRSQAVSSRKARLWETWARSPRNAVPRGYGFPMR